MPKKCKNAKIRDFFTYLGPIFFPRPIFFCTPMARTLCTIYIPVWIKKKISFYSWKKQEPVSIALSTSSSFFGLSLLARLVPMDSVLKSSILIVQRLALHQNGVEFRQQFNGAIRTSLSAPMTMYGVAWDYGWIFRLGIAKISFHFIVSLWLE